MNTSNNLADKIDELKNLFDKKDFENLDKALNQISATSLQEVDNHFWYHYFKASADVHFGKFDRALQSCLSIKNNILHKLKSDYLLKYYLLAGNVYAKKSMSELAIKKFKQALQIQENLKQTQELSNTLFSIGMLLHNENKVEESLKYFNNMIEILDDGFNFNVHYKAHLLKARCLIRLSQIDDANEHYEIALDFAQKTNNEQIVNRVLIERVTFFDIQEKYEEVIEYGLPLIDNNQTKDDTVFYMMLSLLLGRAYCKLKANEKAKHYLSIAEKYYEDANRLGNLKVVYKALSEVYVNSEEYKKANEYNLKLITIIEQIEKRKEAKALEQFQIQFETAEKEKEAEQYKSQALTFQLQSLRAQMNPHFVFNAINSINNSLLPDNIDKSKELLQSFARLMRANLDFAEEDSITLEEEIQFLNDYIALEKRRSNDSFSFEIIIDEDIEPDFTDLPSMLIQPYVENAIKHGVKTLDNGKISIEFKELEDYLICTVQDNGIGLKHALDKKARTINSYSSKSTQISNKRLELINDNRTKKVLVSYKNATNDHITPGTIVTIKIPIV